MLVIGWRINVMGMCRRPFQIPVISTSVLAHITFQTQKYTLVCGAMVEEREWVKFAMFYFSSLTFGKGKRVYLDNSEYEGEWLNDVKHGTGQFTYAHGRVVHETYRHGHIMHNLSYEKV